MKCDRCNSQQMKLSISVVSLFILGTCSAMLCLLVYFLDHLWMIRILFDVNKYCRFFSISKLVNCFTSDSLVKVKKIKDWIGFIICLVLLKNGTHGFSIFLSLYIMYILVHIIYIYINTECKFLDFYKHFVIHQMCQL